MAVKKKAKKKRINVYMIGTEKSESRSYYTI